MPEGPECHIMTDQLNTICKNKHVVKAVIKGGAFETTPRFKEFRETIQEFNEAMPLEIKHIKCKGKFIYFRFNKSEWGFSSSMGTTGNWRADREQDPKERKFYHFYLSMQDTETGKKTRVWLKDMRRQAYLKIYKTKDELDKKLNALGPDLFPYDMLQDNDEPTCSFHEFYKAITKTSSRSEKPIGKIIHDAAIVGGVGNYIRAEGLFLSRISPHTPVKDIDKKRLKKLYKHIRQIIYDSYIENGMTTNDYYDIYGRVGTFEERLQVYGKGKQKITIGEKTYTVFGEKLPGEQQTIYWVPKYQKY